MTTRLYITIGNLLDDMHRSPRPQPGQINQRPEEPRLQTIWGVTIIYIDKHPSFSPIANPGVTDGSDG